MKYVAEQGVTTVHNMGTWDDLETFARAAKAQTLTTRIYAVDAARRRGSSCATQSLRRRMAARTAAATSGCASAA